MYFVSEWSECSMCGEQVHLEIFYCIAGFFIGTRCVCGEETQESGLFKSYPEAENAFKAWMIYEKVILEKKDASAAAWNESAS